MSIKIQKIRELQLQEQNILVDLVPLIEKLGIEYFLSAGTLLGAVRHKGFIPWDDDIDIMMTREHYEVFLKKISDMLPPYYKLVHYSKFAGREKDREVQNLVGSMMIAARIEDTRYHVEKSMWGNVVRQNVWIDIAVLDFVPDMRLQFLFYKYRLKYYHLLIKIGRLDYKEASFKAKSLLANVALSINNRIHYARLINMVTLVRKTDDLLKKESKKATSRMINYAGEYKFREIIPASFLGNHKSFLEFENKSFAVPENYDVYLQKIYGDYMQLPPERERICKHILV